MKIQIELADDQIESFKDFHKATPYNRTIFHNAYQVLVLIDQAICNEIAKRHPGEEADNACRIGSGKMKLFWQATGEEASSGSVVEIPAVLGATGAQQMKKAGSESFWNWVRKQQSVT